MPTVTVTILYTFDIKLDLDHCINMRLPMTTEQCRKGGLQSIEMINYIDSLLAERTYGVRAQMIQTLQKALMDASAS